MTIILECQTEKQNYRWILRQGERARIGKSEWMEFALPEESSLGDEHFTIQLNGVDELVIESSGTDCSITPTDTESSQDRLAATFLAGKCRFAIRTVERKHLSITAPWNQSTTAGRGDVKRQPGWGHRERDLAVASLSVAGAELVTVCTAPSEAVDVLVDEKRFDDALRILIACLDENHCLQWAIAQLQESQFNPDQSLMNDLNEWLVGNSEATRRQVLKHVNWSHKSDPWIWIAFSISWVWDPMDEPTVEEVIAHKSAFLAAVLGALQLASRASDAKTFYCRSIDQGLALLKSFPRTKPRNLIAMDGK